MTKESAITNTQKAGWAHKVVQKVSVSLDQDGQVS